MRILLDESVPRKLGFALPGHYVRTVQFMGWSGLVNGKLLAVASKDFDVLVTGDRNMAYQQSSVSLPMSVVVLVAPNNKLESFFASCREAAEYLRSLRNTPICSDSS